jgi:hypothetical protein
MIETLARLDREWIDRELAERILDLRKTAAFQWLRQLGPQTVQQLPGDRARSVDSASAGSA